MKKLFYWFLQSQLRLCAIFDKLLPRYMRLRGYRDFTTRILPGQLAPGSTIIDIGGGRRPVISPADKKRLALRVTGIDICATELAQAPAQSYEQTIVADLCDIKTGIKGDMVVCLAVLEHVKDTRAALKSIASMLGKNGKALIFVPGRNSLYARLNLLLPEELKKRLLTLLLPGSGENQGFYSYYDHCVPSELIDIARQEGLEVVEDFYYWQSDYFSFFLPLHVAYRLITTVLHLLIGKDSAETFTLVLQRSQS